MKTCDPKCYELAMQFLADEREPLRSHDNIMRLGCVIQSAIEDEIQTMREAVKEVVRD